MTATTTDAIIGVQTVVSAARQAARHAEDWLTEGNDRGIRAPAFREAERMVQHAHSIVRILPRINPARQSHQNCQDLVIQHRQMLDDIPELTELARQNDQRNRTAQRSFTTLASLTAIGHTALRATDGMPEIAQEALAAGNPYAHDLADACWHTMAIVRMITAFVQNQLPAA